MILFWEEFESNIYRLIHGHFHIGLVIIPRPPYWPETESRSNMGRGMITRPIWKCPCIKLFITYFRHLEKRHPYWPETKSRPILVFTLKNTMIYFRLEFDVFHYYHWVHTSSCRWKIMPRWYYPPSSQCFDTDMVYIRNLLCLNTVL